MKVNIHCKPLLLLLFLFLVVHTEAQTKRTGKRTAVKKATASRVQNSKARALPAANPLAHINRDSIPLPRPAVSKEPDHITMGSPFANQPGILAYEPISEDDVAYHQRVWRDIDIREKINLPFAYTAEENNGAQQFIYVLLNAIKNDPAVTAYNAIDDRFTTPLTRRELNRLLFDEPIVTPVPNWAVDSTGNTFKDSVIVNDFNPASITKYRIKEDWVFNKKTSRMVVRILGIAPVQEDTVSIKGMRFEKPLFWLFYPKLRQTLAAYYVYNGRNAGARLTWEALFENRMFGSQIVKSTLDNPGDTYLEYKPGLRNNPLAQLREGEKIKNTILDYEQNLWSY